MSLAHDPFEPAPLATSDAQRDTEDLQWLIADIRGRRIILRLLEQTSPFSTSYRNDATLMALAEGRKQLGYFLLQQLTAADTERTVRLLADFSKGTDDIA
jgi:hypothetical protein